VDPGPISILDGKILEGTFDMLSDWISDWKLVAKA